MSNVAPAFAEEAVIGGLLQDNQRFHDVAPLIGADHFTSPQRARVFGLIRDRVLAGEPADAVTIGEASPDDFDYVVHLAANVPGSSAVGSYQRSFRFDCDLNDANVAGGIGCFFASSGNTGDRAFGAWAWGLSPKLPKTSSFKATFTIRMSWGRYTP